jgi:acyl carrier protein
LENPTFLRIVLEIRTSPQMATQGQVQISNEETANQGLRARVVETLARVRACSVEDLMEEIAASGGDCRIDSKEAEIVIVILEREFDRELAKVEDLEPEEICSVNVLTRLIAERLASGR